jgi:transposase
MMGTKARSFSPLPPDVSLEELVPEDHFYRVLEERLDLSFIRELVAPLYAGGGRPSVDPVVFFKLQLVMFFEGLRSERQLMRLAADRLSLRWYLGYDLFEPLPDHSSLTRIRERFGTGVFRRFFERIVEMCVEGGLVRGEELFFDATKVEANAAVESLGPRWAVEAHLQLLFGGEASEGGTPTAPPTARDEGLTEANAAVKDWISRDGAQDRSFTSGYRRRTSDSRASSTDPDATPMTWGRPGRKLGYQTHYVVDGGKARVILNALVTPSEVNENRPMLDLLWRTCFRWRLRPHHATADAMYGTRQNVAALERSGVRAYVGMPTREFSNKRHFPVGVFRYHSEKDAYTCPANEPLPFRTQDSTSKRRLYRADAKTCNACAQKKECTDSGRGRTVWRHFDEDYFDRLRAYQIRGDYQKALRKRKVWVEPLFAEAKRWHGMDRFRLRTLAKVNQEALMVACVQNLKRLLGAASAGPLRPPTACAQAAGCAVRPPALVPRTAPEILCHPVFLRRFSTRWIVPTASLSTAAPSGLDFRCLSAYFEHLYSPLTP